MVQTILDEEKRGSRRNGEKGYPRRDEEEGGTRRKEGGEGGTRKVQE